MTATTENKELVQRFVNALDRHDLDAAIWLPKTHITHPRRSLSP
jgi:limonene-1,2-epoxide hydrolase